MTQEEVFNLLRDFRDGPHGQSELRAVADFVVDCVWGMDEWDQDPAAAARSVLTMVEQAAREISGELRRRESGTR